MASTLPRYLARIRTPLVLLGLVLAFSRFFHDVDWVAPAGFAMLVIAVVLMFIRTATVERAPVEVRAPVAGMWIAVNSPADRVPSHGTHEYGQTYAIDLVHHPDNDGDWKAVHTWPLARPARTFPGFGLPILAPADGVVVRTAGRQRDHWSRNSWPGLIYLFVVEGIVRGVVGLFVPGVVLGNHIVLDLGDGVYAALAHLKRGSIQVRPGQRVRAGERLAQCGNSGNTSEPHLHFQLMDRPNAMIAAGLPFAFAYESGGEARYGVPRNMEAFTADPVTLTKE